MLAAGPLERPKCLEFFQGATILGEDTSSPYTFNWNSVPAVNYVPSKIDQVNRISTDEMVV